MTIRPNEPWGRRVPRPADLVTVTTDDAVIEALDRSPHVGLTGGDLGRTLGAETIGDRSTVNELPIDLLDVRLGDSPTTIRACAHVVVRSPWSRGGWLRGPVVLIMNAEFIGPWDVAPRGHPNDGRAEVFEVSASEGGFGVRQRLAARRRLPLGTHVPHPGITARRVRSADWTFDHRVAVSVDGRSVGTVRSISITVLPDAATVYV